MPTLSIRFLGGRYHATPWGHHVNEGLVEWPPAPWRLMRALLSTGYTKLPEWRSGIMPDKAVSLFSKLSAVLPCYRMPEAVGTHSRHYMPTDNKPTLVLDAWASCDQEQEVLIRWDVVLDDAERQILADLVVHLSYLGRAESWTEARVLDADPIMTDAWLQPCANRQHPGKGWEQVPVLAAIPAEAYADWRQERLAVVSVADTKEGGRISAKQAKALQKLLEPYPVDIVACLQVETGWLQSQGWSQPPGSQWVLYWRPSDGLAVARPLAKKVSQTHAVPYVLLALSSLGRSKSVLPMDLRTLPQAELFHRALVGLVNRMGGENEAGELIGKDEGGNPLVGHRHAHILPLDLDGDHHLDHVLAWAPDGLGAMAQQVLRSLRTTYMKGGIGELGVRFVGAGDKTDLTSLGFPQGPSLARIVGSATTWESRTPFVPPRYMKRNGRNTLEGQIVDELVSRGCSAPQTIEILREETIDFRHYVRARRHRSPPCDCGFAVRLTFAEAVSGPISLGYASHFGLGLFQISGNMQE